jgi:hypothetical protein
MGLYLRMTNPELDTGIKTFMDRIFKEYKGEVPVEIMEERFEERFKHPLMIEELEGKLKTIIKHAKSTVAYEVSDGVVYLNRQLK